MVFWAIPLSLKKKASEGCAIRYIFCEKQKDATTIAIAKCNKTETLASNMYINQLNQIT